MVTVIEFKRLSKDAKVPFRAHETDSGFDLYTTETEIIEAGGTDVLATDIAFDLPPGIEATVRPRSGLTSKTKLRVQLGTVDNGYRNGVGVILDNIAPPGMMRHFYNYYTMDGIYVEEDGTYIIPAGTKLAQIVFTYLPVVRLAEADELSDGERGGNGFGHSGL